MRVLYLLTDGFGGHGGIAQFGRDCLSAICSYEGVETVVALPRSVAGDPGRLPEKLLYDTSGAPGKLRYALNLLGWLAKYPGFDIIICGHLNLVPLALLARWRSGAPLLLTLHGIEAWAPPRQAMRRRAAGRADWVIAVSEVTLQRFEKWSRSPDGRTAIVPCCVDLSRFSPGEPDRRILEKYGLAGRTVVLTLGRLAASERYKGFDELLEVVDRLRKAEPSLVLVIAGSGDDRARLEARARDLGIQENVRFTGYVPAHSLVSLYRAARAFVLAGYGEGFGIVLLEAMACGVPVVASTRDGSFEVVRGGELGLAVDPRNPDALVAGITQALQRPAGQRPSGLDQFGYAAFETRVHQLLARVCTSPKHTIKLKAA